VDCMAAPTFDEWMARTLGASRNSDTLQASGQYPVTAIFKLSSSAQLRTELMSLCVARNR
jgi:hypothetical protein